MAGMFEAMLGTARRKSNLPPEMEAQLMQLAAQEADAATGGDRNSQMWKMIHNRVFNDIMQRIQSGEGQQLPIQGMMGQ